MPHPRGVGTPVVTTAEYEIGAVLLAENVTIAGFSFDGNDEGFGGIGIFEDYCTLYDTTISGYEDGLHIGYVRGLSLSTAVTLPVGLQSFAGAQGIEYHLIIAAANLVIIPVLIVFLVAQKQIIKGVATTGIK